MKAPTLLPLAALLLAGPAHAQADFARWEPEIQAFEAADRQSPPPPGGVVFVGSSTIRMWETLARDFPGVPVLNRGFGGSELADVVHFADRIVLPYRPRLVMVYAGDNDLNAGKTPERVLADYRALVETIHRALPQARIGFLSIKPSPSRWKLADQMRAANDLVKRYTATDARLFYVDTFTPMLRPDGTPRAELFREDMLHMNAQGYALWRSIVASYLAPPRRGAANGGSAPRGMYPAPAGCPSTSAGTTCST
jgi:lysophospholipase L1-like esterase